MDHDKLLVTLLLLCLAVQVNTGGREQWSAENQARRLTQDEPVILMLDISDLAQVSKRPTPQPPGTSWARRQGSGGAMF